MSKKETFDSSSTSSYSSAEGTPKSSPVKQFVNKSNEQNLSTNYVSNDVTSDQMSSDNKLKAQNKRSSSDGAMIAMKESLSPSKDKLNHQRSRSDCNYDDLIQTTKTRMSQKFDQLEQESGLKLKTKTKISSNYCKEEELKEESFESIDFGLSIEEVREQTYNRLRCELSRAQNELKLRDVEVAKLTRIREEVESELEDLTASLFEEANLMVYNANVLRSKAQKELYEANLKIDVLLAEVEALKMLVLTSTPSNHSSVNGVSSVKSLLKKTKSNSLAKRSPSNYELGGNDDKFDSIVRNGALNGEQPINGIDSLNDEYGEVDPLFHEEFVEWKKSPGFEPMKSDFIKRIYDEEIYPVFNFKNKDLTALVLRAIEDNTISIEAVSDKSPFPKRCALLDAPRSCKYRMKIGDNWHNISQLCRNRIIAVCDLFCYLRYIERGLVKSSFHEVFWEVMRRRKNIALSRLGFSSL